MKAVECEPVGGTGCDALNHGGNGQGRKALGKVSRGKLSLRPHDGECEARDVRTGSELPSARKLADGPKAIHDVRSHTSTRKLGDGNVGLVVGGENFLAWGEDIDLVAKVGERGEGVVDGSCTNGDGLRKTSRGNVVGVLTLISSGNDERDALTNDIGHLWVAC